jgi:HK97 family phage prohead protease
MAGRFTKIQTSIKMKPQEKNKYPNAIKRFVPGTIERAEGDEGYVSGHAAVFNSWSPQYTYFREMIAPGAFDEVDMSDVVVTFNHNFDNLLARTGNGSATLEIDERGLKYRYKTPNTTLGKDVEELVRTQTLAGSSFMFTITDEEWKKKEDGSYDRIIKSIGQLFELGVVTTPWYPSTDAQLKAMRSAGVYEEAPIEELGLKYDPTLDKFRIDLI